MKTCLVCKGADWLQEVTEVHCRRSDKDTPCEQAGTAACPTFSFIAEAGDNVFNFMAILAAMANHFSSKLYSRRDNFGREAIIDLSRQLQEWHKTRKSMLTAEVVAYNRLLSGTTNLDETLLRCWDLLVAMDQGLYSWVVDYWSAHGTPTGVFNTNWERFGYLVPKKGHDSAGVKTAHEDDIDVVTPTNCLRSFHYVPRSSEGFRLTLERADDCFWAECQTISDKDTSIGISQTDLIGPAIETWGTSAASRLEFVIHGSESPTAQAALLTNDLQKLMEYEPLFLLFPELTVPSDCIGSLVDAIKGNWAQSGKPLFAVLGSHHDLRDNAWRNVAPIYGIKGNCGETVFGPIIDVIKNEPVTFEDHPKLPAKLRHSAGCIERTVGYRKLHMVDTPLGRILVVICKDVILDRSVLEIHRARPEMILVPAMTPGLGRFRAVAKDMATRYYSTVAVANSCTFAGSPQQMNSFVSGPDVPEGLHEVPVSTGAFVYAIPPRYRVPTLPNRK